MKIRGMSLVSFDKIGGKEGRGLNDCMIEGLAEAGFSDLLISTCQNFRGWEE